VSDILILIFGILIMGRLLYEVLSCVMICVISHSSDKCIIDDIHSIIVGIMYSDDIDVGSICMMMYSMMMIF